MVEGAVAFRVNQSWVVGIAVRIQMLTRGEHQRMEGGLHAFFLVVGDVGPPVRCGRDAVGPGSIIPSLGALFLTQLVIDQRGPANLAHAL